MTNTTLVGISHLQAHAAEAGKRTSESNIRTLTDKGVISARRDSARRRLYELPGALDQLIAYLDGSRSNARRLS